MIQFLTSWLQHGWHPGHLFELAFLFVPTMTMAMLYLRAWWAHRA